MILTIDAYTDVGNKCGQAKRRGDDTTVSLYINWFKTAISCEDKQDQSAIKAAFEKGFKFASQGQVIA